MVLATALCDTSISICQTKVLLTANSLKTWLARLRSKCTCGQTAYSAVSFGEVASPTVNRPFWKRHQRKIFIFALLLAILITTLYLLDQSDLASSPTLPNSQRNSRLHSFIQLFNFSYYYKQIFQFIDTRAHSPLVRPLLICVLVIFVSFPFTWGYVLVNIATGYWYGVLRGTCIMSASAAVGMSCAWFGVRRLIAGGQTGSSSIFRALSKLVGGEDKLQAIIEPLADSKNSWSILLLLRATPLPFGMINALFAITKLPFSKFLFWSWLGLMPMQTINCWIGSRVATISEILHNSGGGYASLLILLLQLLFSVLFIYCSIGLTRRKLEKLNVTHKNPDGSFYV